MQRQTTITVVREGLGESNMSPSSRHFCYVALRVWLILPASIVAEERVLNAVSHQ